MRLLRKLRRQRAFEFESFENDDPSRIEVRRSASLIDLQRPVKMDNILAGILCQTKIQLVSVSNL